MPGPDRDLLLETVGDAGALARHYFEHGAKNWTKAKGEVVTEADIAVNTLIRERIARARPEDGWLSEETRDDPDRLTRARVWIVDPIDGTIAFVKKRPHFTICIALVVDGVPALSAVFNPVLNELFEAEHARGARLNGAPLRVSEQSTLAGCRMLGSREMFNYPGWPQPWPEMTIENRNSTAYRIALVAAGQFDATMALASKHEWDVAAADLILREAGGMITNHQGEPLKYNKAVPLLTSVVAAGSSLHMALLDRVRHISLE